MGLLPYQPVRFAAHSVLHLAEDCQWVSCLISQYVSPPIPFCIWLQTACGSPALSASTFRHPFRSAFGCRLPVGLLPYQPVRFAAHSVLHLAEDCLWISSLISQYASPPIPFCISLKTASGSPALSASTLHRPFRSAFGCRLPVGLLPYQPVRFAAHSVLYLAADCQWVSCRISQYTSPPIPFCIWLQTASGSTALSASTLRRPFRSVFGCRLPVGLLPYQPVRFAAHSVLHLAADCQWVYCLISQYASPPILFCIWLQTASGSTALSASTLRRPFCSAFGCRLPVGLLPYQPVRFAAHSVLHLAADCQWVYCLISQYASPPIPFCIWLQTASGSTALSASTLRRPFRSVFGCRLPVGLLPYQPVRFAAHSVLHLAADCQWVYCLISQYASPPIPFCIWLQTASGSTALSASTLRRPFCSAFGCRLPVGLLPYQPVRFAAHSVLYLAADCQWVYCLISQYASPPILFCIWLQTASGSTALSASTLRRPFCSAFGCRLPVGLLPYQPVRFAAHSVLHLAADCQWVSCQSIQACRARGES